MIASLALLLEAGCTTLEPPGPAAVPPAPERFSHEHFDRVVRRHVDAEGRVDYAALQGDRADLDAYQRLLAAYSPDSHPEMFPTREDDLAYWINAYNASAIVAVLAYYPIAGVGDVKPPLLLRFLPDKSGFFVFQRFTFGGSTTNLYVLEHRVIRARYREPRVHFALNCASRSCPRLPARAFTAAGLEAELDRETRRFFAEERNLRVDHAERAVHLSSILDWYESDFTDALPGDDATLTAYAALYAPPDVAAELARAGDYEVRFVPYDWRLNDQG